jgi:hypothetical protein
MIRVKSGAMALIVAIVFVAGIGGTMAFNLWKTTSDKQPVSYTSGEFAGKANPADIRGSYALSDIVAAFDVPLADLAKAFGADKEADPAAFQVKSLEGMFPADPSGKEIGTDSVRLFVALYKGLPITAAANTGLPAAAADILLAKAPLDAAGILDVKARVVGATTGAATTTAPGAIAAKTTTTAPSAAAAVDIPATPSAAAAADTAQTQPAVDRIIKGKTTFQEILDWGVSKPEIEKVLNTEMGAAGSTVKEFCTAKGLDFEPMKTALQALVDAKK